MIIENTKDHQHVDKAGQVCGSRHRIMDKHTKTATIRAHNRTIEQDGLTDLRKCAKVGLKRVPYQGGD
jgi:hypothetical protein